MRRFAALLIASLVASPSFEAPARAEAVRTLRVELPAGEAGRFAVENLAGTMRVTPGSGDMVVAVATVHAESEDLADAVKFEAVRQAGQPPTLRVRYPLDRHSTIRYPACEDSGVLAEWFNFLSSGVLYDGHRVKVASRRGALVYADVEVQTPRRALEAAFLNVTGALSALDIEGKLEFRSHGGELRLERLRGEIRADTGSGDVRATELEGSFTCDTGSGECYLSGFKGENIACEVGSGDVMLRDARARKISAETGSGDIHVSGADAEEFEADTGSGDVLLQATAGRLLKVRADTGSGDVTLRLGAAASFEARASQGSGELIVRYPDAQPLMERRQVVGYRRGAGRTRIDVATGSGDLFIEPGT